MQSVAITAPVSDHAERWLRLARAQHERALALLASLVSINSHADNREGVRACLASLADALAPLGFRCEIVAGHADGVERDHLLATRDGKTGGPTLLFLGHADTVFPLDHPFQTLDRRDDRRWIGPGVSDMKGGLATAWLTTSILEDAGILDGANVRILVVGDEEVGSPTARTLIGEASRGVDAALSFEAARPCGSLVSARKGIGVAKMIVRGETGHAGIAHDRCPNALTVLAKWILAAEALEHVHEGLTVSPGGRVKVTPEAVNGIPDRAECEVEWRFDRRAVGERVLRALREAGDALAMQTGASTLLELADLTPPMTSSDALVGSYRAAARELGLEIDAVATAGVGDINLVAEHAAACLDGVGPEGGGFHTEREFVRIDSIPVRAAMNALAIERWIRGFPGAAA